jgi:hypothetical protein
MENLSLSSQMLIKASSMQIIQWLQTINVVNKEEYNGTLRHNTKYNAASDYEYERAKGKATQVWQ